MALQAWPTYARIELQGYQVQRGSAMLRYEMEYGPPKQRRAKNMVVVVRSMTVHCNTKTDYQNFLTWFNTSVNRGADWFTFPDPVTKASLTARFLNGLIESETPVTNCNGGWFLVVKLETLE
jgi:hypothetical protein